jgi:uncharacterized membrane protein (GlpM family)
VSRAGSGSAAEPFVETRAGSFFFLNAVLAGPAVLVLWPVLLRAVLRGVGALDGPSPLLDPVPALAESVGPYVAWLAVLPLVSTLMNLRMPLPSAARWTLRALVLVHVWVLAWWTLEVLGWRLLGAR